MKSDAIITALIYGFNLFDNNILLEKDEKSLLATLTNFKKEQQEYILELFKQFKLQQKMKSDKQCPECKRNFIIIKLLDQEIECCLYCKSYWFDEGELAAITNFTTDIPSQNLRHRESKFNCSICQTTMNEYMFLQPHNVLVDRCPNGHGVYLEKGELQRVFEIISS